MEHHPAGQNALYQLLNMAGPQPHTLSYVLTRGGRRTVEQLHTTHEYYPASAKTDGSLRENLRFSFKHEPLDLRTIHTALFAMGPQEITKWVQDEPTGRYSRLAWFFYEKFIGVIPQLPAVTNAPYVEALDPKNTIR